MFNKKNQSTQSNTNENATSSAYPKDSAKSHPSKGCGCGCKTAAPMDEEIIEIEEDRFDY